MLSRISRLILKIWGWEVKGVFPENCPKNIVIPIPHTSNWDFPVGILLRKAYNLDIGFVGKSSLFKPPLGGIMRWLGGIPVTRSKRTKFVEAVIEAFNSREKMSVCIAPEGTRSKVDHLKTGFYYIAVGAKIPIVMIRFDWGGKILEWSSPFYPTGNFDADMQVINTFFKGAVGKIPEYSYMYGE